MSLIISSEKLYSVVLRNFQNNTNRFFIVLQHMVMSFRVSELQVLLGFAGRNKSGRKHELLQRALTLLQKGCSTPVQIKIRELYR